MRYCCSLFVDVGVACCLLLCVVSCVLLVVVRWASSLFVVRCSLFVVVVG